MVSERDAAALAARYALGDVVDLAGPLARGEQGEVWRLTTTSGAWAVKALDEATSEDEVRDEVRFQTAARAAGVPTPAIVRTADGDVLALAGAQQVRVFDWVDLREPEPGLDPALVGATVAAIHRVAFDGGPPLDPWYTDPVGARRWDELVEACSVGGAPFARRLAEARDELVALEKLLEAPNDLRTCHRDLWAVNLRATADGNACVIDWSDCGRADPSQELALVLVEFAGGDPGRARALHDAYADAGGPARVVRSGQFSMVIAQIGHIGARACARWLEPGATMAERDDAADLVDEMVGDRALTRDGIALLLDAVG
jgi:Ser/Thr protein kinase RdoA (MazF antagonist)